jgi:hypothetical protein
LLAAHAAPKIVFNVHLEMALELFSQLLEQPPIVDAHRWRDSI